MVPPSVKKPQQSQKLRKKPKDFEICIDGMTDMFQEKELNRNSKALLTERIGAKAGFEAYRCEN